jgi:SAM-dependent methyltransferase
VLKSLKKKVTPELRQFIQRLRKPRLGHLPIRRLRPASRFGFDRGQPIDRYYIERFLDENRASIRGVCLEVQNDSYVRRFGGDQVTHCDVLDVDTKNARATIHGDLRKLTQVRPDTYDCVILTQVLQYVDDAHAAVAETYRILKTGGVLLATVPMVGPLDDKGVVDFWRYTPNSFPWLLGRTFPREHIQTRTWGNMCTSVAFLMGLAIEDLRPSQVQFVDKTYSNIISARAVKPAR